MEKKSSRKLESSRSTKVDNSQNSSRVLVSTTSKSKVRRAKSTNNIKKADIINSFSSLGNQFPAKDLNEDDFKKKKWRFNIIKSN